MGIFEAFLALCFLIFFHELGHFCAARAFGVRVEVFSIGFGYKIFTKTIGNTQYAISLIPLGGYVKLKGQSDINPLESDNAPDSYTSKSPLAKIIILLAGVAFNFLLAFLLYFVVGLAGAKTLLPVIGEVAPNSPAQKAGVLAGDVVLAVDNTPIKTWDKLSQIIADSAPQTTAPKSKASDNDIVGARESGVPEFKPLDSNLLDSALLNSVTQASKTITLTIKRANSANPATQTQTAPATQATSAAPADYTILHLTITPEISTSQNIFGEQIYRAMIGIKAKGEVGTLELGTLESLKWALDESLDSAKLIYQGVEKLILGIVPLDQIGGVVGIVDVMSDIAPNSDKSSSDLISFLMLLALISVNLGVLNLLPIPALDGGQILFVLYEAVFRRPINERVAYGLSLFGFSLLIALMLLGIHNDILRIIARSAP